VVKNGLNRTKEVIETPAADNREQPRKKRIFDKTGFNGDVLFNDKQPTI
jgi:hypothetical protein